MKYTKITAVVILISCFFLSFFTLTVYASEQQNKLVDQIENSLEVSVFHEIYTEEVIKCFDVNEDGIFAIGYSNNTIHLYDAYGSFQYGYRFKTDGTYGIALKGNNIVIFLGRSNIAVEIDPSGKCVDAEEVYFSKEIVANVINRTYKQIDNTSYYLERDIGIFNGDYARLVKVDENGNRNILYDVTIKGYFAGALHYLTLSICPLAGVSFLLLKAKNKKHKHE